MWGRGWTVTGNSWSTQSHLLFMFFPQGQVGLCAESVQQQPGEMVDWLHWRFLRRCCRAISWGCCYCVFLYGSWWITCKIASGPNILWLHPLKKVSFCLWSCMFKIQSEKQPIANRGYYYLENCEGMVLDFLLKRKKKSRGRNLLGN